MEVYVGTQIDATGACRQERDRFGGLQDAIFGTIR
jgi:hypothetical protein